MEQRNIQLQAKYRTIEQNETRYETLYTDDADYVIVAFGSAARIARRTVTMARAAGIRAGLIRPVTLWPFPSEAIMQVASHARALLVVEMNAGQMVEDVRAAVARLDGKRIPVEFYGRMGGMIPTPEEVYEALLRVREEVSK